MNTAPDAADLCDQFTALAIATARRWSQGRNWMADDMLSECSFTLWQTATNFNEPIRFFALAARRAMNRACRLRLNRERRENRAAWDRAGVVGETELDPLNLVADDGSEPVEEMIRTEELAHLPDLLRALPADRRRELVERFEGASLADIGAARGVSGSAVGQSIARDLERLREAAGE